MTAEIQPPELAQLVDFAERPRRDDWSLRAALTRYAQPEPKRVGDLLEVVRWVEYGLRPHLKAIQRDGPSLWQQFRGGGGGDASDAIVGLLQLVAELDRLGDVLGPRQLAAPPRRRRRRRHGASRPPVARARRSTRATPTPGPRPRVMTGEDRMSRANAAASLLAALTALLDRDGGPA